MYMTNNDKNALINLISNNGATAVTMLAEVTEGESSHPDTFAVGYLQGYIHGADMACHVIEHCEGV
ncbi:hypothetical protein [uncultured Phocaeicola sp.]|uniref:hypothetical protein n=1 Tax=uncultured Phocaeicola sp. TaxID=990718 RepID=UPI0025D0802C|nr:hypothetical protein [uncultured Phocaeicola sp.]